MSEALFSLGRIVATPGAIDALAEAKVNAMTYIKRHIAGDWGDLDKHDVRQNTKSVKAGNRILSAYMLPAKDGEEPVKIWIITNACGDAGFRDCTTILLPDEY